MPCKCTKLSDVQHKRSNTYIVTDKTVGIAIGIPPTIRTKILSSVVQSFPGSAKKLSKLSIQTNKPQHTPCKASARLLSNRELNDKFQSYTNRNKYNAKEANVLQHILKMALLWREKRRLIIALPLVLCFSEEEVAHVTFGQRNHGRSLTKGGMLSRCENHGIHFSHSHWRSCIDYTAWILANRQRFAYKQKKKNRVREGKSTNY